MVRIDPAVALVVEILGRQELRRRRERLVVEQDRAQDGALGLGAEGQQPFEGYVAGHDANRLSLFSLLIISFCSSARIPVQNKQFVPR